MSGKRIAITGRAGFLGKAVVRYLREGGCAEADLAAQPDRQPRRSLDTSRAERLFAFRARMSFEQGLPRTVEWYRVRR